MGFHSISSVRDLADFQNSNRIIVQIYHDGSEGPCSQVLELCEGISSMESYAKNVIFIQLNVNKYKDLAKKYEIQRVPTVVLSKGEECQTIVGANTEKLISTITYQLEILKEEFLGEEEVKLEKLNERIRSIINSDGIVLFMKGDRSQPRCGFSSTMVDIFEMNNLKYTTFDILQDQDVRQGIKKLSDWPTFPQVYVDGELMGGLDIIKEAIANDEFADMMTSKKVQEGTAA